MILVGYWCDIIGGILAGPWWDLREMWDIGAILV